ncbi:hypothetical protein PTUN_a1179 [Pseudoalteromonas tunicata]|nr:hypothetical protein PTUN_a1179 [Pseudoalteromonas tunicata]
MHCVGYDQFRFAQTLLMMRAERFISTNSMEKCDGAKYET